MTTTGSGSSPFGAGPLAGVRIAVTRPVERAEGLVAPLAAAGATTLCFPLIRIVGPQDDAALRRAASRVAGYDWVVFTSATGVAALAAAVPGGRLPEAPPPRLAVVGAATQSALLAAAGRPADLVADTSVAEGLAAALLATGGLTGRRILWPRAAGARDVLAASLRAAGAHIDAPEAYAVLPDAEAAGRLAGAVRDGAVDVITFTSPSAVRSYAQAEGSISAGVRVAAIGPVTAAAAEEAGYAVHIRSADASADLLAAAIIEAFGKRS